jgi:predicted kinase
MTLREPGILLITGIMAAGKSTVAQQLAERLPKSVHLRGDIFRKMIVNGRVEPTPDLPTEALEQLRLRYKLAAQTANAYCAAGFTVVYQDIVLGTYLQEVVDLLDTNNKRYVVVLRPSIEVITQREAARGKVGYGDDWTPADLDKELDVNTPQLGLWLDTSSLTVEKTVDAILAQLEQAII